MDNQAVVMQARYSTWATRRVLESVGALDSEEIQRDLGSSYGGLGGTLAHIFQADSIWFDRLLDKPTGGLAEYAPSPDFSEFTKQWLALLDRWVSWTEQLDTAGWDRICAHRNTRGVASALPVWQIVLHVVNHASYHRGQITTMLRQLGRTPVGTDLITYYRELA